MTMSTVFLNKERVKILNNSDESYYTTIHIFKKVHLLMYTNLEYRVCFRFLCKPSPLHQLLIVSYYQLYN